MKEKLEVGIEVGTIQETLLLPLWGRAFETRKPEPRLVDEKAVEIVERLDYDFSGIEETQAFSQHGWVARSLQTDEMALGFIEAHPEATIVNIGCGMDTTFSRIDNGRILFYELDLPEVIELRKNFYEENDRHRSIPASFLEAGWFSQIEVRDGLLFLAGGVLYYFTEHEIRDFFVRAADHFGACEFFFDSLSPLGVEIGKRQVLKKGGMEMSAGGGWGLKRAKDLESWDPRFEVVSSTSMSKGLYGGLPLKTKLMFLMPDVLGIASMVHLRAGADK
ncbi:MAG: class I SAM-dependent methyltransferase [Myxococcota bacterium]